MRHLEARRVPIQRTFLAHSNKPHQSLLTTIRITIIVLTSCEESGMYVCLCNGVTEAAIRRAAAAGIRTLADLQSATGCAAGCGCCAELAQFLLNEESGCDAPAAGVGWIQQAAA
jgi:bacterioferritin-associated ferredoxin